MPRLPQAASLAPVASQKRCRWAGSTSRRVRRVPLLSPASAELGGHRGLVEIDVGGLEAPPHLGKGLELLLGDVIEKQLADVGEVPLVGAAQGFPPRWGDSRLVTAKVVGGSGAGEQAVAFETIDQTREAAGGHEQLGGELAHP
jgi:hypothetical protein